MSIDQDSELKLISDSSNSINSIRKGTLQISFKNSRGSVIKGVSVKLTQKSHDFLFGVNLNKFYGFNNNDQNKNYSDRLLALFNYATISSFIWGLYEPTKGVTQEQNLRWVVNTLKAAGLKLKCHTPVWGFNYTYPSWIPSPTSTDFKNRIIDLFSKFPDIDYWDLVNEASHYPDPAFLEYYTLAKGLNSNLKLIMNDFGMFNINAAPDSKAYDLMLNNSNNSIFDIIGLQPHVVQDEATPLNIVNNVVNKFGTLGKKIHITEFMPMNTGAPVITSTWRGNWTEETHAKYITDYYRVCFANQYVSAISYWDFCDSPPPVWREHGGLLNSDTTPKLAYSALQDLIKREWWSGTLSGSSNILGQYSCYLFYGKYTMTATYNGKTITKDIDFPKQTPNIQTVNIVL